MGRTFVYLLVPYIRSLVMHTPRSFSAAHVIPSRSAVEFVGRHYGPCYALSLALLALLKGTPDVWDQVSGLQRFVWREQALPMVLISLDISVSSVNINTRLLETTLTYRRKKAPSIEP